MVKYENASWGEARGVTISMFTAADECGNFVRITIVDGKILDLKTKGVFEDVLTTADYNISHIEGIIERGAYKEIDFILEHNPEEAEAMIAALSEGKIKEHCIQKMAK